MLRGTRIGLVLTLACSSCAAPAPRDLAVGSKPVVIEAVLSAAAPPLPGVATPPHPSVAAPSASAPPGASSAPLAGPATDDPCLLQSIELWKLPRACDCDPELGIPALRTTARLCRLAAGGQSAKVPGLEVTLTLEAAEVPAGGRLEAVLRYRNTTNAPIELHFHRAAKPTLGLRAHDGARLPIEGKDRCAIGGTLSLAELRSVWLAPGAVIHASLDVETRRERRVNGGAGEFDCDVEPGAPLPLGRYQLVLETNALFAAANPAPVSFDVIRR